MMRIGFLVYILFTTSACFWDSEELGTFVTFYSEAPQLGPLKIEVDGVEVGRILIDNLVEDIECGTTGPDRITFRAEEGRVYYLKIYRLATNSLYAESASVLLEKGDQCQVFYIY